MDNIHSDLYPSDIEQSCLFNQMIEEIPDHDMNNTAQKQDHNLSIKGFEEAEV